MTDAAGYSKRSLLDKLGVKPGMRIAFVGAPETYTPGLLPPDVEISLDPPLDLIQLFVRDYAALDADFDRLAALLKPNGMLWVSWYKKSAGIPTDLDENIIRAYGLAHGLVDVKVIAVDAQWSGLKFVYRRKDRP
jgi:hypothetical protein